MCSVINTLAHSKIIYVKCKQIVEIEVNKINSTEFHGTARVIEIGALQVPWNSVELIVSAKLAHSKFHGIPRNCPCQRNWRTPSSMEFHGTPRVSEIGALQIPRNSLELLVSAKLTHSSSMEFHEIFFSLNGTICIIKIWIEFHEI